MNPPSVQALRTAIARELWQQAAALLQGLDPGAAASLVLALPFPEQEALFRKLPFHLAAALVERFPYYHAYVLLHSRSNREMNAIVDAMHPAQRLQFFDELPEEAWQELMNELAAGAGTAESAAAAEPSAVVAPAAEPIIEARRLEKRFTRPDGGEIQILAPLDLSLEAGQILALLGPSGSGKSTLLRTLSGLLPPSSGEVLWHGQPLSACTPNVAIVFQSFALFPWLTVLENVEAPLLARGVKHAERHRRALRVLRAVGLAGFEMAYPKELSGGMKQRAGFARALAVEPEILFMDEPFSALDVLTAENLRGELMELWLGKKIPTRSIFLVTHNIEEAVLLADRVVILGRNPAGIRADFRVPLPQPREPKSAEFLVYVDYIYKLMTQPQLEAAAPSHPAVKTPYPMLPHARPGGIAGLLELVNDRGGKEDLYRIAEELLMEVDDLLPIVEAAALLTFAFLARGDVEITPLGKQFAEADITGRQKIFREAILANVALLRQMANALSTKSDRAMPVDFFRDILDEHFSTEEVQRQVETALNWGRYASLFTYDSESDKLLASQPAALDSGSADFHG